MSDRIDTEETAMSDRINNDELKDVTGGTDTVELRNLRSCVNYRCLYCQGDGRTHSASCYLATSGIKPSCTVCFHGVHTACASNNMFQREPEYWK